jgi:hypothetical protein
LPPTDLAATEPTHVLRPAALQLDLAIQVPPMTLLEFDVVQMWPRRLTMDQGHAWLRTLERDDFSSSRHPALACRWSMIFSENRFPLFGIML